MTLANTDFLSKCSSNSNLKIADFYESNGVLFEDRDSVENLIKETIEQILNEDTENTVVFREICDALRAGDYLALRTESCELYWEAKKLNGVLRRARRGQIGYDIEQRRSKRLKSKNVFPNEQDTILTGFERSVGSMIKLRAHQIHMNKKYLELDNNAKNSVSNGFNSILDLTENNVHQLNQKAMFTDKQWKQLNHLWNKEINWNPISKELTQQLKKIEKLAEYDIKKAYRLSLDKQIKYAFTEEESCFKIYSLILSALNFNPELFTFSNKKDPTEQDFVVKLWGAVISSIFDDSALFTKWGDSVYQESSKAKSEMSKENSSIGDKVDCRVCTQGPDGKVIDLINFEFARNHNDKKFHNDHRKLLREGKVIADHFYGSPFLKKRSKRNIAVHVVQVVGAEGTINNVSLVDNGLYVATKLGSLRLPTSELELRKGRTLMERLFTLKRDAKYLANCHTMLLNETAAALKSMDKKQNNERSPYDEEEEQKTNPDYYCTWVRGSWFPPSPRKDNPYYGQYPAGLFQQKTN